MRIIRNVYDKECIYEDGTVIVPVYDRRDKIDMIDIYQESLTLAKINAI